MTDASLYEILGILETASDEEIRQAYRRKMRFVHPDRGGSDEAAKQINVAYETLSDPQQRAQYDAARARSAATCPTCRAPVRSSDELMGHLVRHRAELEAVQADEERAKRRQPGPGHETTTPPVNEKKVTSRPPPSAHSLATPRRPLETALVLLALVGFVALGVAVALATKSSDTAGSTSAQAPTSTLSPRASDPSTTIQATSTTEPQVEAPVETLPLPRYNGSVLSSGSVRQSNNQEGTELVIAGTQFENSKQDLLLVFDGQSEFTLVDEICYPLSCSRVLNWFVGATGSMWAANGQPEGGTLPFGDSLHMALDPDDGSFATCWHDELNGPVVAVTSPDHFTATQAQDLALAWVFTDAIWVEDGIWKGLDPSSIDPSSVVVPPFPGANMPKCRLLADLDT